MKINEKNLYVFASSPPYDNEGFLNKRGEVNKAFQRRYFVLKGNLLFYFEKKGDKEPLGLIIVEGCTIELSEESDQYCFEIAFNGNRTYVLSADSQESMESWMKLLTCAGYEYKKLMVAELQRQLEEIEGSKNKMLNDTTTAQATIPKPPPRRQNPFNRPAPPPPAANGTSNNTPFINGHFGTTADRHNAFTSRAAAAAAGVSNDTSPVPPPRGLTVNNGHSDLYSDIHLQQQSAKIPSVLTPPSVGSNTITFEKLHERFRQLVMKDILDYQAQRELKCQPLIEL